MKKLFFASALAIVAVGSALTSNAVIAYKFGSTSSINCNAGSRLCSLDAPLYSVPAGDPLNPQDEDTQYTTSEIGVTSYTP